MKSREEFLRTVKDKAEKYETEHRRKMRAVRNLSLLLAICLMVSLTAYLGRGLVDTEIPTGDTMTSVQMPTADTESPTQTSDETDGGTEGTEGTHGQGGSATAETTVEAWDVTSVAEFTTSTMAWSSAGGTTVPDTTALTAPMTTAVSTQGTTTTTAGDEKPEEQVFLVTYEVGEENFHECMVVLADRKTTAARIGRTVDMTAFTDEFFGRYTVYAVWVKNERALRLGGIFDIGGEKLVGLYNDFFFTETGRSLVLVAVSRSMEPLDGCITHDGRVIRLSES